MKITFILPAGGRAGGIKSTVKTANGLLQRGHKVRFLVKRNMRHPRVLLRSLWLKVCCPYSNDWLDLSKAKVERFVNIKRCTFEKNEIVVASGWWAGEEIRQLESPEIIKVHYVRGMLKDLDQMRRSWGENVPKIVVSSYLTDVIDKICGQKVYAVVPNGIDTTEFNPSVPESQRDGVGTIFGKGYHKDPDTVLVVLEKLREECPQIIQRVFGAGSRPEQISPKTYCRLPSLEKTREIYSRSLVWILASCSEGFPAPPLEAMACGCAVVATDCGGPRDIIVDGRNGFLVEVGNVEQIVDRVKLLLNDPKLRQRFVKNSKDTVNRFSWDSSVNKLQTALSNLANSPRTGQTVHTSSQSKR